MLHKSPRAVLPSNCTAPYDSTTVNIPTIGLALTHRTWSSVAGKAWHTLAHSLRDELAHLHRTTSPSASETVEDNSTNALFKEFLCHIYYTCLLYTSDAADE